MVRKHYGIRTDRYKLIHWYGKGAGSDHDIDSWELYDLKKDSLEINNIYNAQEYSKIQQQLHKELVKMRKDIGSNEGGHFYLTVKKIKYIQMKEKRKYYSVFNALSEGGGYSIRIRYLSIVKTG